MEVHACRVCLATETQLHNISENNVKSAFENVLDSTIDLNNELPKLICDFCKANVLHYAEFRMWCQEVQSLLQTKLADNVKLTKDVLKKISLTVAKSNKFSITVNTWIKTPKEDIVDFSDHYYDDNLTSNKEDIEIEVLPMTKNELLLVDSSTKQEVKSDSEIDFTECKDDVCKSVGFNKYIKSALNRIKNIDIKVENKATVKKLPKQEYKESIPFEIGNTIIRKASTTKVGIVKKSKGNTIDYKLLTTITKLGKKNQNTLKPVFSGNAAMSKKTPSPIEVRSKQNMKDRCIRNRMLAKEIKVKVTKAKCSKCKYVFLNEQALQRHHLTDCKLSRRPCGLCGAGFPDSSRLYAHITTEHAVKQNQKHISGKCPAEVTSASSQDRNQTEARDHRTVIQPPKEGSLTTLQEGYKYICEQCGKQLKSASELRRHMTEHTGEKPFECDVCHKRFRVKFSLKTHMVVHTKEKPYGCPVCSIRFRCSSHVVRHMRTHTGEKPYKCDVCQRAFASKSNMGEHIRTVHEGLPKRYRKKQDAG